MPASRYAMRLPRIGRSSSEVPVKTYEFMTHEEWHNPVQWLATTGLVSIRR